MENTIEAVCTSCEEETYFVFDGQDWECQSCGALNSQEDHCDPEDLYSND